MARNPVHNNPPRVRLPAEWEPHRATHLAFPVNCNDWPGKFSPVRWAFVEMVRHIARHEKVHLACDGVKNRMRAERMFGDAGVPLETIEFHSISLDRGWMRDISPFFVYDPSGGVSCVAFRFTGWAKYANHALDAVWPQKVAAALRLPMKQALRADIQVVMEGGAVDTNGRGTLLTTEECLLDAQVQVRNPGFSRKEYEEVFRDYLGVCNVIWLGSGIAGDDTHGHVDDVCRFVNPGTVVLCREKDPSDENYRALEENRERLEGARLEDGGNVEVVELPMPAPLIFRGLRLPASYANFYIANGTVIVPTFNDPMDRHALGILGELFPERSVVGIHAVDLVWGFGTLHCLSHEEPLMDAVPDVDL